ncbi:glycosyltransferase [Lysobacter sp. F6437]|uniref:glycosyltransferase n=1 Tax=Lysobacter sp. F6437 TaxID=3459296 RepID=UPI00403E13E7
MHSPYGVRASDRCEPILALAEQSGMPDATALTGPPDRHLERRGFGVPPWAVAKPSCCRHIVPAMDILLVSDVYFPRVNGVSTSIRVFARNLVRLGHRVTLVAPDYGEPDAQRERDSEFGAGFRVLRLPASRIFFDPEDRLFTAAGLQDAFARLAALHWDVVHVHTPFRAHRLAVRLARALGVPVLAKARTRNGCMRKWHNWACRSFPPW